MSGKSFVGVDGEIYQALTQELAAILARPYNISKPSDRRDRAARIVNALNFFIMRAGIELPEKSAKLIVNSLHELVLAMTDLDQGRNPPLFDREIKAPNNNTKAADGLAYDLIIACRRYLVRALKIKEGIAESEIENYFLKSGITLNVDSLTRAHSRESARHNRRADLRDRVIEDQEAYKKTLNYALTLLMQTGTIKKSHKKATKA